MTIISIIIPTYNEEQHINRTIDSIECAIKHTLLNYEIIVMDNGSTDQTVQLVQTRNIPVFVVPNVFVGELRNIGAQYASGDILVFIDADVTLNENWGVELERILESLKTNPLTLTGAQVRVPPTSSWVARGWYTPVEHSSNPAGINTGHMITTRYLFTKLNGFDNSLETGEDIDFSQRAVVVGAEVINNTALIAWHHGFPGTLKSFFDRQRWHGRSTATQSIKIFSLLLVNIILFLLSIATRSTTIIGIYTLFIFVSSTLIAHTRCHTIRFHSGILAAVYLFARTISLIDFICNKSKTHGTRAR